VASARAPFNIVRFNERMRLQRGGLFLAKIPGLGAAYLQCKHGPVLENKQSFPSGEARALLFRG